MWDTGGGQRAIMGRSAIVVVDIDRYTRGGQGVGKKGIAFAVQNTKCLFKGSD
jgi:hypothetical protein